MAGNAVSVRGAANFDIDVNRLATFGGLVLKHFGRLPKRGEKIVIDGLRFEVLRVDSRRLYTLRVDRAPAAAAAVAP